MLNIFPIVDSSTLLPWQLEPLDYTDYLFIALEPTWSNQQRIAIKKNGGLDQFKYIFFVDIYFVGDNCHTPKWHEKIQKEFYPWIPNFPSTIHTNMANPVGYYDFLFNRQKAFFTDYYTLWKTIWTSNSNKRTFQLTDLPKNKDKNCIPFIYPARIYLNNPGTRIEYRKKLRKFLLRNKIKHLFSPLKPEYGKYISETKSNHSPWLPIANDIYNSTYASIYVESLTGPYQKYAPECRSITEKTWDPIIKGHFILPFSYLGIISDLKNYYGICFPDEIDYTYDTIPDLKGRFKEFCKEIKRLNDIDWQSCYRKNRDMLIHNRSIFFDRPYSKLPIKSLTS